ncbi:membrane-bound dehydrogenase domain protein : Putative membrane-bound dehydrogenase OS=Singulisphaera acidiphila (strain ATCC BAA-1392 / DSM 18658 / VKM B-2454 / MOB10) GN=Sinac_5736 PE=4 SV=1: Cytochrom_C [Gemmataceae bacterium]|nr:membrane-bound dehydrogenase domain protein : Putative membrane-bound dehydrogenase OS=Singulisphaera acidiphila (strain ATCC BAA-1392 / DSM 18658 / VKM B-2454 / MOB10) GN=Sinac_5736 PE=4 SV=1: Cytochrom_C [Gemmataceae bacterium]VTT99818.1 membrane-bound dehydrogenase domain protein : Putative membrane-bound dehydrogenase OS=Singulisphaera acidiphila (strain ATCC BAA-1392 / DSM 18658 / VKM B-2454 / MOB10) GN=Sinac_5736 PE=4 SV=1: Cytochrom_C [Gemmataceae bacterium]
MRTAAFSLLLLAVAHTAPGAAPTTPAAPDAPKDGPVPTKDAAAKMTVPPGFKVTLFAGEPDIVQPIAFTFDDRGRMWVVECLSYPKWSKDGKGSDRVVILEDTDGNGTFDKKTVFMADGVNLSGIELGFGGAWLCSSPNLLFVPILADDKPGKPEVVLDGWNMTDTKHNIFNSLGWGPDGWLYGCNGIQAKAWVGRPGTPKEKRPYMDCGVWRYHPTRKVFEPVAHGTTNPFGLDWDEHGEMFITNCVIDHLFHVVPGGHYQRMYGQDANPHAYGLMKSCVDYKHWAGGDWTSSRTTGTGGKPEHSDAGGGHAHSGCAIYLGDNFPAEYRNTLFTANIHGNRLNNDGLERTPSGMKGVRRKDFLFANDSWFRGICVKCGPDGALYVSDWCDTGECHNYDKADTSNGRIYRVSYGDPKQWKGDVSKLSDAELVANQRSANEWLVRKSRRVLKERAAVGKLEKDTVESLKTTLSSKKEIPWRLRALWSLEAINALDRPTLEPLFEDADPTIRGWAYRLAVETEERRKELLIPLAGSLGKEKDLFALTCAASAAQRVEPVWRSAITTRLMFKEETAKDPYLEMMVWYAVQPRFALHPSDAARVLHQITSPVMRRNAVRFIMEQPAEAQTKLIGDLLERVKDSKKPEFQLEVLRGIREGLTGKKQTPAVPPQWAETFSQVRGTTDPNLRREVYGVALLLGDAEAQQVLSKTVSDPAEPASDRISAIELLLTRKRPEFAKTLRTLLDDPAVRTAAIRGLAAFADAETPAAIIRAYSKFTPEEKLDAVQTLAARKEWAAALLDAVEKKDVPRADIPVTTARQIHALNDKALSTRLETVWGKIGVASKERAALTKKWKELLTEDTLAKANASNGRALFAKHCGACHKMFGEGQAVGPELTGSQRTSLDYVLENVLDPSAVVPREFQMVNFATADDRVISGIVLRETKDAVTVRTTNDTVVLPAADIAARKQTNVSIMPDGLLDQMKPDEVRDLIAFLRSKEQVPLPK